jgi:predicted amidohydrolase
MAGGNGGPRKVVVGTTMLNLWHGHPGLEARLEELGVVVDRMAAEAERSYPGAGLDLAALPEVAVSGEAGGDVSKVACPLDGPVLDIMGARAREHGCYIVVPLYLVDDAEAGLYSNAAALIDRAGQVAGVYRKVFAVANVETGRTEGGVTPGNEFPVFQCDFGRVGAQICYDMAFDEGWPALARKGAELIIWPSQWPGQAHPCARALRHRYFILSSTWNVDACLVDPTGHVVREIRENGAVLVEQIDLDYVILNWASNLKDGKAFDEKYGDRAGYRYSRAENEGIFWSNDPDLPIREMARELGFTPRPEALARAREVQDRVRGGPAPTE